MNAPLARHLSCFSRLPPAGAFDVSPEVDVVSPKLVPPEPAEPTTTMTVAPLEERIETACHELRTRLGAEHSAERESAAAAHAEDLAAAVAVATAGRDAAEGAELAAQMATAHDVLRDELAAQIARALRPLLAEAIATRTLDALIETVERVLADPDHPVLTIRGPTMKLAAIERALAGRGGILFQPEESGDVRVAANGIRIETRLDAALAALAVTQEA